MLDARILGIVFLRGRFSQFFFLIIPRRMCVETMPRIPRNIQTNNLCQVSSSNDETMKRFTPIKTNQPVTWLIQYICFRFSFISFVVCCPSMEFGKTKCIFFSFLIKYKLIANQDKSVLTKPGRDK